MQAKRRTLPIARRSYRAPQVGFSRAGCRCLGFSVMTSFRYTPAAVLPASLCITAGYVDNKNTLPTYPTVIHREPLRCFAYGLTRFACLILIKFQKQKNNPKIHSNTRPYGHVRDSGTLFPSSKRALLRRERRNGRKAAPVLGLRDSFRTTKDNFRTLKDKKFLFFVFGENIVASF